MYRYLTCALWFAALALPAIPAHAQDRPAVPSSAPSASSTPSAASADARVPETKYDSAFTGYQPFREQKLAPWRELNDEAHKAGGHIGIFGGAGVRAAPASAPAPHSPEHKK